MIPNAKRTTHRENLIALFGDGQWHDQHELVRAGGLRYGARIYELRELGYVIEARHLSDDEWSYRMIGAGQMRLL